MNLVMFDVDGTLVESYDFDSHCFEQAVSDVLNIDIDTEWSNYTNVTDSGILDEIISLHGIAGDRDAIQNNVREEFIRYLKDYLTINSTDQIVGAAHFLDLLKNRADTVLAIATGGWEETAKLKLHSAEIDYSGIAFASSSDHFERTSIMTRAKNKTGCTSFSSISYFGDGSWDRKAAEYLGYNFILVGNRTNHYQQIDDFSDSCAALTFLGLET